LEILFDIPVNKLHTEISDRQSFQKFLGVHNALEIPQSSLCAEVKNALYEKGLYENIVSLLEVVLVDQGENKSQDKSRGNIEKRLDQFEEKLRKIKGDDKETIFIDDKEKEEIIPDFKNMNDNSSKIENITASKNENSRSKSKMMNEKLKEVNEKIDNLLKTQVLKEGLEIQKPGDAKNKNIVSNESKYINGDLQKLDQSEEEKISSNEKDIYKNLFDSFYNQFQSSSKKITNQEPEQHKKEFIPQARKEDAEPVTHDETSEKLKRIEEQIKKLYDKINLEKEIKTVTEFVAADKKIVETEQNAAFNAPEKIAKQSEKIVTAQEIKKVEEPGIEEEDSNFIDLRKKKRYHIFNNTNLTEDYELGLRFYKLGFKTAFINMRADEKDENSRIATAEYFPNSFWGSVKQRSRWIAGIVFQNWKIHKWEGNLKTKYFLLRDRKALFSFFGIFLSNIVFAYFLYYMLGLVFNYPVPEPNVEKGTFLWFLMIATLFFLTSRIVHRFASTYNWYGFKYAALSIVRLIFDNLINLFATLRAINVYNTNKKQIVWDSTDHY
jgi:hypothetical protein